MCGFVNDTLSKIFLSFLSLLGAMPGIKNPILVAKLLVQEQQKGLLPLGRVPPGLNRFSFL